MHWFRTPREIIPAGHPDIVPLSAVCMDYVWSCDLAVSIRHKTGLCEMCWTRDSNGMVHTRDDLLAPSHLSHPSCAAVRPAYGIVQPPITAVHPPWTAHVDPHGQTLSELFRPLGPTDPHTPIRGDATSNENVAVVADNNRRHRERERQREHRRQRTQSRAHTVECETTTVNVTNAVSWDTMANVDFCDDVPMEWEHVADASGNRLLAPDQPVQTWVGGDLLHLTHTADIDATVLSNTDQSEAVASDFQ